MEKHSLKNILNFNSKCYSFKYIKYNDGLFDKTVSATYVIHLKGNGRYENIISQLNEYHPTSDVYILLNIQNQFLCLIPLVMAMPFGF